MKRYSFLNISGYLRNKFNLFIMNIKFYLKFSITNIKYLKG